MNPKQRQLALKSLERAVTIAGNASKLGKELGLTRAAVSKWVSGDRYVSFQNAIRIERLTKGFVKAHDLRPDIEDF